MTDNPDSNVLYILGEIRADMKNLLSKTIDQDTRLNGLSGRITAVERFQYKIAGGAIAVSTLVGVALKLI